MGSWKKKHARTIFQGIMFSLKLSLKKSLWGRLHIKKYNNF